MRHVRFAVLLPALALVAAAMALFVFTVGAVAQSSVGDAVDAVCSNNGALLKWLGYAAIGVIPATVLTNIKAVHNVPVLGLVVNIIAGNWRSWLRDAAARAASRPAAIVVLLCLVALGACSNAQLQQAQTIATTASAELATACKGAQASLATAQLLTKGGANQTVQNLASYINAGCPIVGGIVTVAANVAADPTSTAWVQGLATGVQAAVVASAPRKS